LVRERSTVQSCPAAPFITAEKLKQASATDNLGAGGVDAPELAGRA
jgi:hypothetical protein